MRGVLQITSALFLSHKALFVPDVELWHKCYSCAHTHKHTLVQSDSPRF